MKEKTFAVFFESFPKTFSEHSDRLLETRCSTAIYFDASQKRTWESAKGSWLVKQNTMQKDKETQVSLLCVYG